MWRDAAILLVVALVLRCAAFGDPNIDPDETFYWLVGRDTKLPSLTSVPKSPARLPVRDHKLLPTLKAA